MYNLMSRDQILYKLCYFYEHFYAWYVRHFMVTGECGLWFGAPAGESSAGIAQSFFAACRVALWKRFVTKASHVDLELLCVRFQRLSSRESFTSA
jgi:hypothetical protein